MLYTVRRVNPTQAANARFWREYSQVDEVRRFAQLVHTLPNHTMGPV